MTAGWIWIFVTCSHVYVHLCNWPPGSHPWPRLQNRATHVATMSYSDTCHFYEITVYNVSNECKELTMNVVFSFCSFHMPFWSCLNRCIFLAQVSLFYYFCIANVPGKYKTFFNILLNTQIVLTQETDSVSPLFVSRTQPVPSAIIFFTWPILTCLIC